MWFGYRTYGEVGSAGGSELVTTLANVRAGETRTLDIDVSHLAAATLLGVVRLNGAPARGLRVWLTRQVKYFDQERSMTSSFATSEEAGRFEVLAVPGEYRLHAMLPVEGASRTKTVLDGPGVVHLGPGGVVEQDFDVAAGGLEIRFLQHDGQPAGGVTTELRPRAARDPGPSRSPMPTVALPTRPVRRAPSKCSESPPPCCKAMWSSSSCSNTKATGKP